MLSVNIPTHCHNPNFDNQGQSGIPFLPPKKQKLIANGHILPTGQWYAPSAVINDAFIMPEYARVCKSIPEYARVCQSIPEYARVCLGMPEYARVCQSMPEYARVCQGLPEYARVCQSMPEYTRVCQSMPEYARV